MRMIVEDLNVADLADRIIPIQGIVPTRSSYFDPTLLVQKSKSELSPSEICTIQANNTIPANHKVPVVNVS